MEIRFEKQEDRNHFLWISGCLWESILGSLLFPLGFLFVLCLGCVPDGWQSRLRGAKRNVFRVIWGSFFTLFEVSLAPLSNETRVPEKHPRKTHGKYKKKRARI